MTLLRAVASRLLCGGDVSVGALSPDLKTLTRFRRMTVTWAGWNYTLGADPSRRRDDRSLDLHPFPSPLVPNYYRIFQISVMRIDRFLILLEIVGKRQHMKGIENVTNISHVFL